MFSLLRALRAPSLLRRNDINKFKRGGKPRTENSMLDKANLIPKGYKVYDSQDVTSMIRAILPEAKFSMPSRYRESHYPYG